jgi:CxxC motif-containing protein
MLKEYNCIICPNGCDIEAEVNGTEIISIDWNLCPQGVDYVQNELICPMRTIASSVKVENGELPIVSVRLTNPVPKDRVFEVIDVIRGIKISAPLCIGDVVKENILGLGSDLIVTKNVGVR